ncbi:4Fe-4S binding protein [Tropicibacter sp. R15_0]|uniref:4Fe-4S binding protein n=1 Tax=Tropicibacter sp. R15_0 TaxID=2821101 RepID=UPI001AD9F5E1|nr:4Fe-4S binding protein [Tropicibacter sp. R15_0]MBO9463739.1 4Fe-4S binding protein [Tropicibacter sp. R15_0]
MSKSLILCDCMGTMQLDQKALAQASGLEVSKPCSTLCTTQIDKAAEALTQGDTIFCCTQEARIFESLAEEVDAPAPPVLDLRDRAGWSADDASKLPKMSALIAEALLPAPAAKTKDVVSEGLCLITGPASVTLPMAEQLKEFLSVTVLLDSADDLPETPGFDVVVGQLHKAQGALGQFDLTLNQLQIPAPGGKGPNLSEPRNGGRSQCDILIDVTGGTPLFPAPEKREGYLRADPSHPPSVAAAVLAASHMVGTFEKPLYVKAEPLLCAHSRAEKVGCHTCLDLCPTSAITPNGDHVSIDPIICAGCGACSAACPSGAISYDAPPVDLTMMRIQTLAKAYLDAGGQAPRLIAHDAYGADMIRLSARHGDGLPADVIPLEVPALNLFGHAEIVAALAAGFASVSVLPGPATDRAALATQIEFAAAIGGAGSVTLLDTSDPDAMSAALFDEQAPTPVASPVRPMGTRRQITRQAARALHPDTDTLPLPAGAPYGAVEVNTDSCTLCLSCVSLCPSGALGDNPDLPQLRFQEDACLQCGLCSNVCPENAISYLPQLNLTEAALTQQILNEEEPFACIECGTLFGVKSTIEKITEKLEAHSMFQRPEALKMIQMCDDCRVNAQFHAQDNPFAGKERPKPRTTEDYLSKRRDH